MRLRLGRGLWLGGLAVWIFSFGALRVVVKIRVPFGVPIIIRHLLFRVPKKDQNFDNHLMVLCSGFRGATAITKAMKANTKADR